MAAVVPPSHEHAGGPPVKGPAARNSSADARGSRNASGSRARPHPTPKKRGSNERTPSEKRGTRPRQTSLRRVKNSTDMLRERSLHQPPRSQKEPAAPEVGASGREGKARQFTVANVGNNGMIYLRPVQRPQQQPIVPQNPPFALPPSPAESAASHAYFDAPHDSFAPREGAWTHASTNARAYAPRQPNSSKPSENVTRPKRSMSSSTIETTLGSDRLGAGAFKIVIDRPVTAPKSDEESRQMFAGLEVPIPHYRLGTPRFSAMGTAFLHQSTYTRSSAAGDQESSLFAGPEFDSLFARPPGIEAHAVISRRHSHTSHQAYGHAPNGAASSQAGSLVPQAPHLHRARGPITPALYEALAKNPNDPAIVKYSPLTGDIVAASPARIIAQVTSENFLDYELLSDFFLTVRCYLSTHDLLAYLLARFEWAINRFDDNGRVIRVRAFAALRHWILNYFSYDFVIDRDLRVHFCNRLNALTQLVKPRADYGTSDMKLIADLKKCWNGRCMLFWDSDVTPPEKPPDDIQPGGILGSRNSELAHHSQLPAHAPQIHAPSGVVDSAAAAAAVASSGPPDAAAVQAASIAHWYTAVAEHAERQQAHGHGRQDSTGTSRSLPISPTSEQSMPVVSCSIPTRAFGNHRKPYANRTLGIHPVPTDAHGRRICPAAPSATTSTEPVAARPATAAHRRSGSFSDATRDKRAPLSSDLPNPALEFVQEVLHDRSLLRGHVIPPGPAYVAQVPITPVTELDKNPLLAPTTPGKDADAKGGQKAAAPNPAVKSIIGNIRRALSSKYSSGNAPNSALPGAPPPPPGLSAGKSASIPLNVMYQAGEGSSEADRGQLRVDLLSVEACEAYQRAVNAQHQPPPVPNPSSIGVASGNEREQPSPFGDKGSSSNGAETGGFLRPPQVKRLPSGVTDSSQSILIADDTGLNIPDIPAFPRNLTHPIPAATEGDGSALSSRPPQNIGLQPPQTGDSEQRSSSAPLPTEPLPRHYAPTHSTLTQRPVLSRQGAVPVRQPSHRSTDSTSNPLRRYASFQSTFTAHRAGRSVDLATAPSHSASNSIQSILAKEEPARLLRRRPGGDLRANQNVHELEQQQTAVRPMSTGSIADYAESLRGSEMLTFGDKITKTFAPRKASREDRENAAAAAAASAAAAAGLLGASPPDAASNPSMLRTHSSQPEHRRPSFEAAVAEFARIPDDDEGGIEATLLKLEGRYQKSPGQSPLPGQSFHDTDRDASSAAGTGTESGTSGSQDSQMAVPPLQVAREGPASVPARPEPAPARPMAPEPRETMISTYAESEESFNPVPLLERGADDWLDGAPKDVPRGGPMGYLQPPGSLDDMSSAVSATGSGSSRLLRTGSAAPTATTDSFLLDENDEFLSDVSSELSDESDGTIGTEVPAKPEHESHEAADQVSAQQSHARNEQQQQQQQQHPPRGEDMVLVGSSHPPSPPMTMENAIEITSQTHQAHEERKPPTPKPSPVHRAVEPAASALGVASGAASAPPSVPAVAPPPPPLPSVPSLPPMPPMPPPSSRHMPFVLGYDSAALAQQLTLIEKDALKEVDWRDLVEMRWLSAATATTNWVEYLLAEDPPGIDLVTARFNLVVKWVVSEVLLTQGVAERAATVAKFVHVAQQARRLHNFATLLQITVALTSADLGRLRRTWAAVPAKEKAILHELEALVSPRRNFNNLRMEMEKVNTDQGCIPVVALYIHDLTYNAQKPSEIAGANPDGEPLINFERFRSAALIVKNLLRLIDASAQYTFVLTEGLIDRCLWLASLSDEVIAHKSKNLEAGLP